MVKHILFIPRKELEETFEYKKLELKKDKIKELLSLDIPKAEIARLMNCSWITLHRYIQRAL